MRGPLEHSLGGVEVRPQAFERAAQDLEYANGRGEVVDEVYSYECLVEDRAILRLSLDDR